MRQTLACSPSTCALRRGATVMLHLQWPYLLKGHTYHAKAERNCKAAAKEKRAKEADEAHDVSKAKDNGVTTGGKAADHKSQAEGANGRTAAPTVNGEELDGNGSDGSDLVADDSDDEADDDLDSSKGGGGDINSAGGLDKNHHARALLDKLRRSSVTSLASDTAPIGLVVPGGEDGGSGGLKRAPSSLSRLKKQTGVAGRASSMFSKVRHSRREAATVHVARTCTRTCTCTCTRTRTCTCRSMRHAHVHIYQGAPDDKRGEAAEGEQDRQGLAGGGRGYEGLQEGRHLRRLAGLHPHVIEPASRYEHACNLIGSPASNLRGESCNSS